MPLKYNLQCGNNPDKWAENSFLIHSPEQVYTGTL